MDRISVFYLPPYFSFSAWYNGMTRPKWMRESRPYVVYGMRRGTHTSTSDGIYIGVTSRPLHVRLREHVAQATQGSKCPLHVAMREAPLSWKVFPIDVLGPCTFAEARAAEKLQKRQLVANDFTLLNRTSLRCE